MKIRAVRLRELGCFSEPVAIEGFSGGLDVLSGRNEFGKSTLLRAVRALFTYKHSAKSVAVQQLRSYSGGSPLVEVDFEASGGLWRLRKQYLTEPQALLTDLATGKVAARGESAHDRALALCDSSATGLFGLLWVSQTHSLEIPAPERESRVTLESTLEQEIAALTGATEARAVRVKAAAALDEFVTPRAQRPTGAYKTALVERERLVADLARAKHAAEDAARRLQQLAQIRANRSSLADPAVIAANRRSIADLQQRIDEAMDARRKLEAAAQEHKAAQSAEAEARQAHEFLRRDALELAELEETEESTAVLAEAQANACELEECLAETRAKRDVLRSALKAARADLRDREAADRAIEAARSLRELEARLADARGTALRIAEIENRLRANRATNDLITSADREDHAIAILEARLDAARPRVRISYVASPLAKFRSAGRPLADGDVLSPAKEIAIEVEGIGAIAIEPGVSDAIEKDRADLASHRRRLSEVLGRAGVTTIEEARNACEQRRALASELSQSRKHLELFAPRGIEVLAAEKDGLTRLATPPALANLAPRPEIEAEIARLVREEADAEDRAEKLAVSAATAREGLAHLLAGANARQQRLAELQSRLPPLEVRAEQLRQAQSRADGALESLNLARLSRAALAKIAPSDGALDEWRESLAKAVAAEEVRKDELHGLDRQLAMLEGQLERDHQDDLNARIEQFEGELAAASAHLDHCRREAAALQLLIASLDEVEKRSRATFVRPLVKRLEPLLDRIVPGASVEIGQDLRVERVARGAAPEAVENLSQGTREQISVLVRLAFASLLSDSGRPAPLILDDALVYSDDVRIGVMFDILRRAAEAHQIVVLTCRTRTFGELGGTRLDLRPWQPT